MFFFLSASSIDPWSDQYNQQYTPVDTPTWHATTQVVPTKTSDLNAKGEAPVGMALDGLQKIGKDTPDAGKSAGNSGIRTVKNEAMAFPCWFGEILYI